MALDLNQLKKKYSDFITRQGLTPAQIGASAKSMVGNVQADINTRNQRVVKNVQANNPLNFKQTSQKLGTALSLADQAAKSKNPFVSGLGNLGQIAGGYVKGQVVDPIAYGGPLGKIGGTVSVIPGVGLLKNIAPTAATSIAESIRTRTNLYDNFNKNLRNMNAGLGTTGLGLSGMTGTALDIAGGFADPDSIRSLSKLGGKSGKKLLKLLGKDEFIADAGSGLERIVKQSPGLLHPDDLPDIEDIETELHRWLGKGENKTGLNPQVVNKFFNEVDNMADVYLSKKVSDQIDSQKISAEMKAIKKLKAMKSLPQSRLAFNPTVLDQVTASARKNLDLNNFLKETLPLIKSGNPEQNTAFLTDIFRETKARMPVRNPLDMPSLLAHINKSNQLKTSGRFTLQNILSKSFKPPRMGIVDEATTNAQPVKVKEVLQGGYDEIGSIKKAAPKTFNQKFKDFYTDFVDRFAPIDDLAKKATKLGGKLTSDADPYRQARTLMGANGMAYLRFQQEMKPILAELDSLGVDSNDIDLFLKSKRDINLAGREIKGSDATVATQRLEALTAKYGNRSQQMDAVANKLYALQNKGFQELVDAGFISPEVGKTIRDVNQDYVPFHRVMDEVQNYLGLPTTKLQNPGQPIKKIKGSDRQIISPLESIISNIYTQRAAIQKNKVALSIAKLGSISPEMGIKQVAEAGDNTISVWQNGKKVFYEVPEDVARAVKGLNEENMGTLVSVLSAPAQLLRQGATGRNIDFMVPNMIKDQFDAAVNTRYGYTPFLDWGRGLMSLISKDEYYQKWMESGASQSFGDIAGRQSITEAVKGATGNKKLLQKVADWAISGLDTVGKYSEQPTRIGAFKKAFKKGADMTDAALESRDITMDFARMGAKMKVANAIIPFLNVEVQAFDRLVKNLKTKPAQTGVALAAYGALPVTLTTLYNMMYHPDEYKDIPEYEKDTNIILVQGRDPNDGTVKYLKIPMGNSASLASGPTRSLIEFVRGEDEVSFRRLAYNLLGETLPVLEPGDNLAQVAQRTIGSNMPQIIKPAAENALNASFFKGKEIVPFYLKDKPPAEQAFKSTEALYKYVGNVLNVSPLQVKNIAEGYGASFAKTPANLIEAVRSYADNKPINRDDIPVLRRFAGQSYPDTSKPTAKAQPTDQSNLLDRIMGVKPSEAASKLKPYQLKQYREEYKLTDIPSGSDDAFKKALKLAEDTELDTNVKAQLIDSLGVKANDIKRYQMYTASDEDKARDLRDRIAKFQGSRNDLLRVLIDMRKPYREKTYLTNQVLDYMVQLGTLSENEASAFKKVKYNKLFNKLELDMPKTKKAKKVKLPTFKPSTFKVTRRSAKRRDPTIKTRKLTVKPLTI